MSFPVDNPVLIMAIAMLVFLLVPLVFERYRLPGLIGLILAGAVVGPNGLNLLARDTTLQLLGTVGLLYLMFIAGLELDLAEFRRNRRHSLTFGLLSFAVPLALALLIAPRLGFDLAATLLIGAIVATHTLLAYPIASRLGIVRNPAVVAVVGGTLLTDTLSLTLLAGVAGAADGDADALFWILLALRLSLFAAVVLFGLPRLARWFLRQTDNQPITQYIFVVGTMFGTAFLAQLAGAQPIIGAFLAGLVLNRLIADTSPLMNRTKFIGNALFVPFFLFSVGMLVDYRVVIGSSAVWVLALALTAMILLGKGGSALLAQRLLGYSRAQGLVMAGLSIPQAAGTLAVTFVGLEIGLFGSEVVNAVILLILASCFIGPYLVERYGRAVAREEEATPYTPDEATHRILVPLANPATAEALMNLALLLREPDAREPIYPMTVVPEGDDASTKVAAAERMLAKAVIYAAGADVPSVPLTRVAQNPAGGIMRAILEHRITEVVIGWNGKLSGQRRIFGSVIDQLLEQSSQLIAVCKAEDPLETMRRLVVVFPPLIDHHPGYYRALRAIKVLAHRIGVNLLAIAVQENGERYAQDLERVKPEVAYSVTAVSSWSALLPKLRELLTPLDLLLVVSVRQGRLAWSPQLATLPGQLTAIARNFIVLYPPLDLPAPEPAYRGGLPVELSAERVLFDLPRLRFEEAVTRLLSLSFDTASPLWHTVHEALINDSVGFATEVLPDALVSHARVEGLKRPMMFLGVSPAGIVRNGDPRPRHVLALLLSPAELPPQQHLERLARLGQLVAENGSRLVSFGSYEDLVRWAQGRPTVAANTYLDHVSAPEVLGVPSPWDR